MRFAVNTSKIRTKRFFALFPIVIGSEGRWLEYVTIEQQYIEDCISPIGEYFPSYWENLRFLN